MTPDAFFRLISFFTAAIAVLFGILAVAQLVTGHPLLALPLLFIAAVNVFGWHTFRRIGRGR